VAALWWGMNVGLAIVSFVFLFLLARKTNWQKECELAQERIPGKDSPLMRAQGLGNITNAHTIHHHDLSHPGHGHDDDDVDDEDGLVDVDDIDLGTIHAAQSPIGRGGRVAHFATGPSQLNPPLPQTTKERSSYVVLSSLRLEEVQPKTAPHVVNASSNISVVQQLAEQDDSLDLVDERDDDGDETDDHLTDDHFTVDSTTWNQHSYQNP